MTRLIVTFVLAALLALPAVPADVEMTRAPGNLGAVARADALQAQIDATGIDLGDLPSAVRRAITETLAPLEHVVELGEDPPPSAISDALLDLGRPGTDPRTVVRWTDTRGWTGTPPLTIFDCRRIADDPNGQNDVAGLLPDLEVRAERLVGDYGCAVRIVHAPSGASAVLRLRHDE